MSAEEFLCVRCSRHMRTCCQTSQIYVTLGDVRRIEAQTGSSDFYEIAQPDDPIYHQQHDDPTWQHYVIREDGSRRVLKRKPDGECQFLGTAGCVLPMNVRPLICRIYPYDYNADGIYDNLANGCPLELLAPGKTLLQELDMNLEEAKAWHAQLYQEIREERPDPPPATKDASCASA